MLLVASLCLAAADAIQPQLPDPGSVSGITKQDQKQAGLKAMAQVYKQMPVLPGSSEVTQYVQELRKKPILVRSANLTSTSPVQENGKPLAEPDWLIGSLARMAGWSTSFSSPRRTSSTG